jgi:uncharacterized protein (DUF2147 family)
MLAVALCAAAGLARTVAADAAPASAAEPALVGRWLTEPRDGIIEITRAADGSYQGQIIGGSTPGRVDEHNPDPSRRQQGLLGRVILAGMHAEGEGSGVWSGGTIYEPDSGRAYRCRLELIDRDHLKVRGFIGFALLGRSQTWTRYTGSTLDLSIH